MSKDGSDSSKGKAREYFARADQARRSAGQRRGRYEVYAIIAEAFDEARGDPALKRALGGGRRDYGSDLEFFRRMQHLFFGPQPRTTEFEMTKNIKRIWSERLSRERVESGFRKYGQNGFYNRKRKVTKASD